LTPLGKIGYITFINKKNHTAVNTKLAMAKKMIEIVSWTGVRLIGGDKAAASDTLSCTSHQLNINGLFLSIPLDTQPGSHWQ
jgi:hypothetical protein